MMAGLPKIAWDDREKLAVGMPKPNAPAENDSAISPMTEEEMLAQKPLKRNNAQDKRMLLHRDDWDSIKGTLTTPKWKGKSEPSI
jgi:hypothetical protein